MSGSVDFRLEVAEEALQGLWPASLDIKCNNNVWYKIEIILKLLVTIVALSGNFALDCKTSVLRSMWMINVTMKWFIGTAIWRETGELQRYLKKLVLSHWK